MKYITLFETSTAYNVATLDLPNVSLTVDNNTVHYNPYVEPPHDYSQDYFTMVVTSGGDIKWSGSTTANTLSYSKDNGETWTTANSATPISVTASDKVLWKGTPTPQSNKGIGKFSGATDVRYSVEGNAMSLLFGDNFKGQTSLNGKSYALYGLFNGNKNVTSAENLSLPATTLANNCYYSMFASCTSLTTAPELPATTLVSNCYQYMFASCTSLTTVPSVLPATTLAESCYDSMFSNCTNLTAAPELPATTLAYACYNQMFNKCTSLNSIKCLATNLGGQDNTLGWVSGVAASGTFVKNASMTSWTSGSDGIPNGWTVVDV